MITLLDLLKRQGKALVLHGPEGCGKGLLANQLSFNNCSQTSIHDVLNSKFRDWLRGEIDVVVVEGIPDLKNVDAIKQLITSDNLECKRRGQESITVNTPIFIFCGSDTKPIDFGANDRRFYVIEMDTQS